MRSLATAIPAGVWGRAATILLEDENKSILTGVKTQMASLMDDNES